MARYVIGDVQGCLTELKQLLALIQFNSDKDQLWFCGDLIARGPHSLQTLRFVKDLGANAQTVLGNHDLNFLASLHGFGKISAQDHLSELQQAKDLTLLTDWFIEQPLLYYHDQEQLLLVHAGLAPEWDIPTAVLQAQQAHHFLLQDPAHAFSLMYGNQPERWDDAKNFAEKFRFSINSLTRMRYCYADGRLDFKEKSGVSQNPELVPWFEFWKDKKHPEIFFGHWAALMGQCTANRIHALDTGCVWGNSLSCYCIESQQRYSVKAVKNN